MVGPHRTVDNETCSLDRRGRGYRAGGGRAGVQQGDKGLLDSGLLSHIA